MHSHRPPLSVPALPPPAAVDRLVQVYVDFVQIMLPILHMPTFQKMLARVRGKSPDVTDADIFFVLMVLGELEDFGGVNSPKENADKLSLASVIHHGALSLS